MQGRVFIRQERDGLILREDCCKNMILDSAMDRIMDQLLSYEFSSLECEVLLGDDGTPPERSQTGLQGSTISGFTTENVSFTATGLDTHKTEDFDEGFWPGEDITFRHYPYTVTALITLLNWGGAGGTQVKEAVFRREAAASPPVPYNLSRVSLNTFTLNPGDNITMIWQFNFGSFGDEIT